MNKSIKLLSTILVALLFVPAAAGAQPIPQYQLSIQHPQLIGTAYRFDINLRRVGATPFRLGNSQFILTFNAGQFSSPAISRVGGSEEIGTGFFFDQVISGGKLLISLGGNGSYDAATDIDAGPNGTRISTFEVTGVNVPILSAGLTWVNPPELIRTGLSEIDASDNYRDITDGTGASHINGGGEFARISGYAFNDLNGNGVWDQPSEPGLDGWTIALAGPNGPFMATTGTTPWAQGFFEFVNISPGSIRLLNRCWLAGRRHSYPPIRSWSARHRTARTTTSAITMVRQSSG